MRELELLSEKLDTLLKKYEAVKAENRSLKETVTRQLAAIEALNGKLATVEEQVAASQMGTAVAGKDEQQALRKQLDGVIGEIDKILTTLND